MRTTNVPALFGLSTVLLLAVGAFPVGAEESKGKDRDAPPPAIKNRERWERLPPEKRREIQEIFDRLQGLPPERRKQLLDRLRSMDPAARREALRRARERMEEELVEPSSRDARAQLLRRRLEALPPAERERLRQLPPPERRRYLIEKVSGRRRDLVSRLPEPLRRRVESLPPEEQAEVLRRFRGEEAFRETFRDPREVARLRAMPPRKLAEVFGVARAGGTKPVPSGKPELLSEETWKRWLELKPFEKPRVLRQLIQGGRPRPPPPPRRL